MSNVLKDVDARTRLAGTGKLELLLFTLDKGSDGRAPEVFGINVFKIKEVIQTPEITRIPDAPPHVLGMTPLRGEVVSVIDLVDYCGKHVDGVIPPQMIVTEFSRHIQAFLVHAVETIVRIEWQNVSPPPDALAGSKVTAVTQLEDGRLVSILDVEQILHGIIGDSPDVLAGVPPLQVKSGIKVLCADDTEFARKQLKSAIESLGVPSDIVKNGREAWERLESYAKHCEVIGVPVSEICPVVITDIEMPELDGFLLTKKIKEDARFAGIKVLIHSSMSGQSNVKKANEMGADGFLAKFSVEDLCANLRSVLPQEA